MIKGILILTGTVSLGLGVLGIFVPGLPTTPFMLLTAICFVKSSPVLYNKLVHNQITGQYIRGFEKGYNKKLLLFSITIMWLMILITEIWVFQDWFWKILLLFIGIVGTIFKARLLFKKKNSEDKLT